MFLYYKMYSLLFLKTKVTVINLFELVFSRNLSTCEPSGVKRRLSARARSLIDKSEVNESLTILVDVGVGDAAKLLALTLDIFGNVQPPLGLRLFSRVEEVFQQQTGRRDW